MKTKIILVSGIFFLILSIVQCNAIQGLTISLESSNVILRWPSYPGETFIVQHRSSFAADDAWETLTNGYPAFISTNWTIFVHSNQVTPFLSSGGDGNGTNSGVPSPFLLSISQKLTNQSDGENKQKRKIELPPLPWDQRTWKAYSERIVSTSDVQSNEEAAIETGFYRVERVTIPCTNCFQVGDLFIGIGSGVRWLDRDGNLKGVLTTTYTFGMAFDHTNNLYVATLGTVTKFDKFGNYLGIFGGGYINPESVTLDSSDDIFVSSASEGQPPAVGIRKFNASGNYLATYGLTPDPRSDWMDLASDQCTMFYTRENRRILRRNVCNDTALSDFATLPGDGYAFAIRILLDGEVIVADGTNIKRLDKNGNVIQSYDVDGVDRWFSLALNEDGKSFWSAALGGNKVYQFDLASGSILKILNVSGGVQNIAVFGDIRVGQW